MADSFEPIIEHLEKELSSLHVGRVSPGAVEHIMVEAYDVQTPITQLASVTNQGAQALLIQPWDAGVLKEMERALHEDPIDASPVVDGQTIRLTFPPLTEEKRKDIVKRVKQKCEEAHVAVKKVREDSLNVIKKQKQDKEISEDDFFAQQKSIQGSVDTFNKQIDDLGQAKETEVMTV